MTNTTQKPPKEAGMGTMRKSTYTGAFPAIWNTQYNPGGNMGTAYKDTGNNWNVKGMNKIKGATGPAAPLTKYPNP